MFRTARITGSFVVVVIAYWAYSLLAVPWIEPAAAPKPVVESGGDRESQSGDLTDDQVRRIRSLFQPDDWELKAPKILESDRARLLFQTYKNMGNGLVKLDPCTVLFDPDSPVRDEAQRVRQTIILQAPQGARSNSTSRSI